MGSVPFRSPAEALKLKRSRKRATAAEYVPDDEKEAEDAQRREIELQEEIRESVYHAGDRSYMGLSEGTFQRMPVRYDE